MKTRLLSILPKCLRSQHESCSGYGTRIIIKDNVCAHTLFCPLYFNDYQSLFTSWNTTRCMDPRFDHIKVPGLFSCSVPAPPAEL
jgi:hypothetical protein